MDDQHHRALLTEYQVCQQRAVASSNWVWQSATVMISAAFVALALISQTAFKEPSLGSFLAAGLSGFAVVFFMPLLRWYLDSEHWAQRVAYSRMNEIEAELGDMRVSTTVWALDHFARKGYWPTSLPGGQEYYQNKLKELELQGLGVRKPAGFTFIRVATIALQSLALAWILLAALTWLRQ